MPKLNLVYIWSLRNAAADQAGQFIDYKGERRYMMSPLEYLVSALDGSELGEDCVLTSVIHDDDRSSATDRRKVEPYGFDHQPGRPWFFPPGLTVQGRPLESLRCGIPSSYRKLPLGSPERVAGKGIFERGLLEKLVAVKADVVLLDGLLVILDELIRPGARFHRKVVNIHPGITRLDSPYERRGAYATLDALHGARGRKVTDWTTMAGVDIDPVRKTGASFHYVDNGIDSGEVITDVLGTDIDPGDTILELRWNNFNRSLFPAMHQGLSRFARAARAAG